MKALVATLNRVTRFSLSVLLWAHALFDINIQRRLIWPIAHTLHVTAVEFVLLSLLILFSYLASTGFWPAVGNFLYIYFFPFVLLFYVAKWLIKLLLVVGRWLNPQAGPTTSSGEPRPKVATILRLPGSQTVGRVDTISDTSKLWHLLVRPVSRFTVLWCLLLLVATHIAIIWVALVVTLIHIGRFVVRLVRISLGSQTFFATLEEGVQKTADDWLAKLALVTRESPPTPDLRVLWQTVRNFELGVLALKNETLVARWAALLCGVFLGCVYVYMAFICSFAYYGIERLAGYGDTWPQLLITSLFIPFLLTDLPKVVPLRLLGGLQCAFVLSIGIGTITRYLRSHIHSLRTVATIVDVRFADETVKAKYEILKQKFESQTSQLNQFDVATYNALTSHQAALKEAKTQYEVGGLPAGSKEAINTAAESFNAALSSWLTWRNIYQGTQVGDQVAAEAKAVSDLAAVNTAVANMKQQLG